MDYVPALLTNGKYLDFNTIDVFFMLILVLGSTQLATVAMIVISCVTHALLPRFLLLRTA
jgi:hypothetical protein